MSLRLCTLTLVLFVSGCAGVRKTPAPAMPATTPVTASAPGALAKDLARYNVMFQDCHYDELLVNVNGQLAALPADKRAYSTPYLLYVRGLTHYRLGWYKEAKADLLIAQKAKVGGSLAKARLKQTLQNIEDRTPLLPPNIRGIRDGERVTFRMHSFAVGSDAAMVAEMLPTAYLINRQIFGKDVEATTILVFDKYDQFSAFQRQIHNGKAPREGWYPAVTTGPVVQISLRDKKDVRKNAPGIHGALVHEVNHAMINRLMGKAPLPQWFKEGLAQIAETQVYPRFDASRQKRIARLFQNNGKGLLPMGKLKQSVCFREQVDLGIAMRKEGAGAGAPDPYAQSYGMMKYLFTNFSTPQLQSFLRCVRASNDFDDSFAAEFGLTPEQFYQKWKTETARMAAR